MEILVKRMAEVHRANFVSSGFSLKLPGFSLSVLPYLGGTDYLR